MYEHLMFKHTYMQSTQQTSPPNLHPSTIGKAQNTRRALPPSPIKLHKEYNALRLSNTCVLWHRQYSCEKKQELCLLYCFTTNSDNNILQLRLQVPNTTLRRFALSTFAPVLAHCTFRSLQHSTRDLLLTFALHILASHSHSFPFQNRIPFQTRHSNFSPLLPQSVPRTT